MPATPLRVAKLTAVLGMPPKGALVTVTNSVVAIAGTLPVEQAALIRRGAPVRIDEPTLGIKATGTVTSVADRPGTDGADAFHVAFAVAVPKPPPALVGTSVRLTVPIRSTRTATLAVPASAVSLAPDGASRVQRADAGKLSFIPVDPGLSADGYVAVKPRGQLAKGDLVVVGFDANRETRGR